MKDKDLLLISKLRLNARESLTNLSKSTKIPVSTIYDRIKNRYDGIVRKHTVLLDFDRLGYHTRATFLLRARKEDKDAVKDTLLTCSSVNSIFRINNGYDFLVEGIFRNIQDVENFIEEIENKFKIVNKQVFYIVEELKREAFMSTPIFIANK